jgi:hypothetical protein
MVANRPEARLTGEADVGAEHLTRNVAWVVVKALFDAVRPPASMPDKAVGGRHRTASPARALPETTGSVEAMIKRAETAVAEARDAEHRAMAAVAAAGELADAVKAVTDAGEHRVGEATQAGQQQVQREVEDTRQRLDALLELERTRAERRVAQWIRELTDEADAEAEKVRAEAQRAAKLAQRLVN